MRMCMRTNLVLNDELLAEARKYSHARSKRALVEEALATYVAVKADERQRLTYRQRLQQLRERAEALRVRSDSRDLVRKDRDTR